MLDLACKYSNPQTQQSVSGLPEIFCWTKMGAEAGQSLDDIVKRKELERLAGHGVFAWGIGNSLGKAPELARQSTKHEIDVLFTPMKSVAKEIDTSPSEVLVWLGYFDSHGSVKNLPAHMLITSRGGQNKKAHYALLCHSKDSLLSQSNDIAFSALNTRNYMTGNPVGASQVTSVVKSTQSMEPIAPDYSVRFRAKFYADGFVKLAEPVVMTTEMMAHYANLKQANTVNEWKEIAQLIKSKAKAMNSLSHPTQLSLC